MSSRLTELGQRKQLLVARLHLQRMETSLRAAEVRDAFRPASLVAGAIARPATLIAVVDAVASLFGLRRFARIARIAALSLVVSRAVRRWRGRSRATEEPSVVESPRASL
jgi:hypothetical protein